MFKLLFCFFYKTLFFLDSHFETRTKSAVRRLDRIPGRLLLMRLYLFQRKTLHSDQLWLGVRSRQEVDNSFGFMMTNSNALSLYTESRLWEDSVSGCCENFLLDCLPLSPHTQNIHIYTHAHTHGQKKLSVIFSAHIQFQKTTALRCLIT